MKDSLKNEIGKLVEDTVSNIQKNIQSSKRIVLFSSGKFSGSVREVLNYTENRLLNTQFKIDHNKIRVEVIPRYGCGRHRQVGDYAVDVGAFLAPNFPELF